MGMPEPREVVTSCAVAMLIMFGAGVLLGWALHSVFGG